MTLLMTVSSSGMVYRYHDIVIIDSAWDCCVQRKPVALVVLNNGSVIRVYESELLECGNNAEPVVKFAALAATHHDTDHLDDATTQFQKFFVLKEKKDDFSAIEQRIDKVIEYLNALKYLWPLSLSQKWPKISSLLAATTDLRTTNLLSLRACCLVTQNSSDKAKCQATSVKNGHVQLTSMDSTATLIPLSLEAYSTVKCIEHTCTWSRKDLTDCDINPVYKWISNSGQLLEELVVKGMKSNDSNGSRVVLYTCLLLSLLLLLSSANCSQGCWRLKGNPSEATFLFVAVYSFHSVATLPSPSGQNEILLLDTRAVHRGQYRVSLRGSPNEGFCARIAVGSGTLQEFCFLVDTGSANFAVAGRAHLTTDSYFQSDMSSSYTNLGTSVSVSYTAGKWTGMLSQDYILIGGASRILAQFVLITKANQFFLPNAEWEGILGMAYSSLAKPDSSIKTFWEMFKEANSMEDVFSIQLCPPIDNPVHNQTELRDGIMVLGGSDPDDYRGGIHFTDVYEEKYYSVVITNLTVGNTQINIPCKEFNNDQTIVDSGTTDIFFPVEVFTELQKALSSNMQDNDRLTVPDSFWVGESKLAWPTADKSYIYDAFPTFFIGFATSQNSSQEFSLAITPQIYLRQVRGSRDEQVETNCLPECDFFEFGIKRRERGTVIGGNVMLGFYTIFNRKNRQVGFAESAYCEYQDSTTLPYIVGPYQRVPDDCECHGCSPGPAYWEIISYVCGCIVFLITIFLLTYLSPIKQICKSCRKKKCTLSSSIKNTCVKILCCCINCCKYKKVTVQSTNSSEDSTELLPMTSQSDDHDGVQNVNVTVQEIDTDFMSKTTVSVESPERECECVDHDEIEMDFESGSHYSSPEESTEMESTTCRGSFETECADLHDEDFESGPNEPPDEATPSSDVMDPEQSITAGAAKLAKACAGKQHVCNCSKESDCERQISNDSGVYMLLDSLKTSI